MLRRCFIRERDLAYSSYEASSRAANVQNLRERRNGLSPGQVERIFSNSICPTRTLFLSPYGILGSLRYISSTMPPRIHQSRVIKEEVGLSPGEWDRNVLCIRAERRCRNHGLEEERSSAVAIKKRLRATK